MFIGLQPDKARFDCIGELQLLQFAGTAATVSQVDCLGNFTKNLDFFFKSRCQALDIVVFSISFVPFLGCTCTRPKKYARMLIVDYCLIHGCSLRLR